MDILQEGIELVLKVQPAHEEVEGQAKPRFNEISKMKKFHNTYGPYLGSVAEGNERYFISASKSGGGPRSPEFVLRKSVSKDEKSQVLCGLFERKYDNGTTVYKGKNRDTGERYLLAVVGDLQGASDSSPKN